MDTFLFSFGVLLVPIFAVIRFFYLATHCGELPSTRKRINPCKTLIVVGAGGHAMEMMKLLSGVNLEHYKPREYVVALNDQMSRKKIEEFEKPENPKIWAIMRARQVGQSYFSSVFTTLSAILHSVPLVFLNRPDVVLCNGPGTCIPICFLAYLLKFFGLKSLKIIYVESICRVEFLSLSAILLYRLCLADQILVQWPQLAEKYSRIRYIGRLI